MPTPIAAHFEELRRRFPAKAALPITNTQQSIETMEFIAVADRPPQSRCAFFEIGGTAFLVWEMDSECDRFQVFATMYHVPLGILRLSSNPSGVIVIAGFYIDLAALASAITAHFNVPAPPEITHALSKRKIMLFGFYESFGHHFWNEVGGLAIAKATGLLDRLDGVIVGPFDYFNLGPALQAQGKDVWKLKAIGSMTLFEQLFAYSSNVVTEEARQLVLDNAAEQESLPQPETDRHMICFQIRRHRRPWINEEDGLYHIISACSRLWPEAIFIIDGHSTSSGLIAVKQTEIEEETALAARLAKRLGSQIDLRSTIGMSVNAKINLFRNADLFVGPIGSGGVLSSWLLRKPTIAYGPSSFYEIVRHQDSIVPEGGSPTMTVPLEAITDCEDDALSFDVDPDAILNLIKQAMNKLPQREPRLVKTA